MADLYDNSAGDGTEAPTRRTGWFDEARFGMFIHFGLYSIPAGVWNGVPSGRKVLGVHLIDELAELAKCGATGAE